MLRDEAWASWTLPRNSFDWSQSLSFSFKRPFPSKLHLDGGMPLWLSFRLLPRCENLLTLPMT